MWCSAVVSQKLEKDKRMSEEAYRHWSEIAERRMDFYRYGLHFHPFQN